MWQRFTERARKVVFYSQEEAGKWGENIVSPEHLLLGLVREDDSLAARLLGRLGVKLEDVREEVQARLLPGEGGPLKDLQLSSAAKQVIDFAYEEVQRLGDNYVGTEHLLLAFLHPEVGIASEVLKALGASPESVLERLEEIKTENKLLSENPSEELLTLDEAVKFLGTSKPTLYRLLGQDEIKGLKVGRQWRFRKTDLVAYMNRSPVAVAAAPKEDLDRELAFFAEQLGQATEASGDNEAKTKELALQIIRLAIQSRASDIHLEPTVQDFLLRFRVDGVLQEVRRLPASVRESLTAQIKTLAEMDVSEKKLPQEGRIPIRHNDKEFDLRAASIPSVYGEALTIRILDRSTVLIGLDKLGLTPEDAAQIRGLLQRPNGIFLTGGPAESGKTTLLYSCLQEVAGSETRTMTVEDPVEFVLAHTTQVQVNTKIGLTFAAALRSFSRQDPDIILVGELPDVETATLAVEAALNGHLVLSLLPAKDAVSALGRLLDIGTEPYLVTATVAGVVAGQLCRRLCPVCKVPASAENPTLAYIVPVAADGGYAVPGGAVFFQAAGCEQCRGRGYKGRLGLFEVLTMTEGLAEAILRRASAEELTAVAVAGGMRTLLADGVRKAAEGQTTLEEVLRVCS